MNTNSDVKNKNFLIFFILTILTAILLINLTTDLSRIIRVFVNYSGNDRIQPENVNKYFNIYTSGILITVTLSGILFLISILKIEPIIKKIENINFKPIVITALIVFILIFSYMSLSLNLNFYTYTDLAVHSEILWKILKTGLPITTIHSSINFPENYLASHFSIFMYFLIPIYYFFPSPNTLILLQIFLLSIGALPIYLYAKHKLNNGFLIFVITMSYFIYPTIGYISITEFEYLRFSIPFLGFAFYFLIKSEFKIYAIFIILAISLREDISLTIFSLGIYIYFIMKERKIGIATTCLGILYFFLQINYLIPYFSDGRPLVYITHYPHLGNSPFQILKTIIFNPFYTITTLLTVEKLANIILFLLPLGFLSLFSPAILIMALPSFITSFLAHSTPVYSIFLYYLSPALPFMFFGAINSINKISDKINLNYGFSKKCIIFSLGIYLLSTGILSNYFFGPSPISKQFWYKDYRLADFKTKRFDYSIYKREDRFKIGKELIDKIPLDAKVSAQNFFMPHLFNRRRIYMYPYIGDAEYIILDEKHHVRYGIRESGEYEKKLYELKNNNRWTILENREGYWFFKKK